ncbi:hypothetical protein IMG5_129020 [Ichthyophthirius multifiliis]|uniref:glycerol-3-phosphate dehydrogenase n=1 Tax=Ichthyophthirius multifiliis TaxID=5932 RepID=G0QW32_ICHMU|nr:hypothetical protein IMG5_129020 [Ichthyophthirius multifiliis]EGR30569.1 hypothetical protein IMG5_129020 [Ichthyophthirius multifiliis]|eukprot:XP_004032156.1 hypothetical protein IMG5_129020 [Ichthyophthirius multifiliis]
MCRWFTYNSPEQIWIQNRALLIPQTEDGRVLFVAPWQKYQVIGTTEQSLDEPIIDPKVQEKEISFMAKELSQIYTGISQEQIQKDISSKWAGIRPLILENKTPGQHQDTKEIVRKHVIEVSDNGLISLMGGKWTIYRKMGEETVNKIEEIIKKPDQKINNKSTCNLRLLGEANKDQKYKFPNRQEYINTYAELLAKKHDIQINVAKYEMAQYPSDILLRRMRLGFIDSKAMEKSIETVCEIFASELKWDKDKLEKSKKQYKQDIQMLEF